MLLAGFLQAVAGLTAISKEEFYTFGQQQLLVLDVTTWGWVHLAVGILLLCAAWSLFSGHLFGRVIGITLATLSAAANMLFLPAYPIWSIIIIVIDVLIIHSLAIHGRRS
jgi:hypothetical protein